MANKSQFSDDPQAALMLAVAKGDETALRQIIENWKKPIINFFYQSLGSYEEAEDLAQTVFVKLYRAAPRYQPTAKLSTYIFHIARRLLLNEFRRQKRKPLHAMDPADLAWRDTRASDDALSMFEIEDLFSKSIQEMPENHRTAMLLLKQQGLSYQEIAEVMDAKESVVKTWIFRARQKLKDTFAKADEITQ